MDKRNLTDEDYTKLALLAIASINNLEETDLELFKQEEAKLFAFSDALVDSFLDGMHYNIIIAALYLTFISTVEMFFSTLDSDQQDMLVKPSVLEHLLRGQLTLVIDNSIK